MRRSLCSGARPSSPGLDLSEVLRPRPDPPAPGPPVPRSSDPCWALATCGLWDLFQGVWGKSRIECTAQRGQMGRPNIVCPREFLPDLGVWASFPSVGEVSVCQRCTLQLGFQRSDCRTPKGTPPLTAGIDSFGGVQFPVIWALWPVTETLSSRPLLAPRPTSTGHSFLISGLLCFARSLFLSGEPALPASVSPFRALSGGCCCLGPASSSLYPSSCCRHPGRLWRAARCLSEFPEPDPALGVEVVPEVVP